MKATIEVQDRKEAALVREGLADPETRAFVKVVALLRRLPSDRARARVMSFVADAQAELRAK